MKGSVQVTLDERPASYSFWYFGFVPLIIVQMFSEILA